MKKIVIIGASSGIGARVATDFARMGWRVGIAARREDMLKEIKALYPDRIEYMAF
ncbi:MAG: SDR family NAD(P)-dependent oxidoreductase, partial [Muribaculaceae bacterium]|nr:SDR family NAD(P)-dependent oxidoreductase [Muribaculaceae bacterium]